MKKIILLFAVVTATMCSVSAQNDYIVKTNVKPTVTESELSQEEKFIKDNFQFLNIGEWQSTIILIKLSH